MSLRVYLLFSKYYREVVLMCSRYKKFKEAEFFTRTDTVTSSLFAFLQIIIEKCLIMRSRNN